MEAQSPPSVVVTGASTGIGWGCVKVLVGGGCIVFGGARRREDAERLKKEFGEQFRPPGRIGETVKTALFAPRLRTRYTVTSGRSRARATPLPKRFADRIIARQLGLTG